MTWQGILKSLVLVGTGSIITLVGQYILQRKRSTHERNKQLIELRLPVYKEISYATFSILSKIFSLLKIVSLFLKDNGELNVWLDSVHYFEHKPDKCKVSLSTLFEKAKNKYPNLEIIGKKIAKTKSLTEIPIETYWLIMAAAQHENFYKSLGTTIDSITKTFLQITSVPFAEFISYVKNMEEVFSPSFLLPQFVKRKLNNFHKLVLKFQMGDAIDLAELWTIKNKIDKLISKDIVNPSEG